MVSADREYVRDDKARHSNPMEPAAARAAQSPYHCPGRIQPNPMYPPTMYKPLYAYHFQPKGGMRFGEPPVQPPLFYSWSPDCVARWLTNIGLDKYSNLYRCRAINGTRLYHMEAEDHHRLGVRTMCEADHIYHSLKALDECVENEKAAMPTGIPYHYHKYLYFGEHPLCLDSDNTFKGCSE